jgi:outer membrane lipoprotein carrier protein
MTGAWLTFGAANDLDQAVAALQKKYSQVRDLKMEFVQNHRNPRRGPRTESGLLYLRRPGMMRWEYRQPSEKLFVSDGKMVNFYLPEDRQVQRGKVKESRDLRLPFLFLLGRGNLRKDFSRLEWAANEKTFFAGNRSLFAYPKKGGEEFAKVLLEYDPSNWQLQRIVIYGVDDSRSEFIFTQIRENAGLSVNLFNFQVPAGVEVVGFVDE